MPSQKRRKAPNSPAGAPFQNGYFGGNDTALAGYLKQSRVDRRQKRGGKRGRHG